MSRANTKRWVKLVAGLLLGTVTSTAHAAYYPEPEEVVTPAAGRPAQAHDALNKAIESHRRGDYEAAAPLFREASAGRAELSPTERQELDRLQLENREALAARHLGAEQLRLAETALRAGRTAEAGDKLRLVAAREQYLTMADRLRFQQIQGQERTRSAAQPGDASAQAHAKVLQARAELNQYDLDAAERLAREAERLNGVFSTTEDSPKRVLQDVATALGDAKMLLSAARAALKHGNFDRAETLAKLSDQKSGTFTFPLWASDSPSKALKDIDAARKQAVIASTPKPNKQTPAVVIKPETAQRAPQPFGNAIAQVVHKTDEPLAPAATPTEVASVKTLVFEARHALEHHDLAKARQLAEQARSRTALLGLHDDSPDLLIVEIAQAEAGVLKPPVAVAKAPVVDPGPKAPTAAQLDAVRSLFAESRRSLAKSEFKKARQFAEQARAQCQIAGIAKDGAEQLLNDITRAEAKAIAVAKAPASTPLAPAPQTMKVDSYLALLDQSRQEMTKGDLKKARQLAEQARSLATVLKLHDDGADKLLVEIAHAQPSGATVTQTPAAPVTVAPIASRAVKVTTKDEAVALLRQGRTLLDGNKLDDAIAIAVRLKGMNQFSWGLFEDTPDKLQSDVEKIQHKQDQAEAAKVLAEGHRLLEKGDYPGATAAAYKASKLHGSYSMWDFGDRPSKLVAEIEAAKARDHKVQVQAPQALVRNDGPRTPEVKPTTLGSGSEASARQLLAEARVALKNNDTDKARELAGRVEQMHVALNKPGDDSPSAVYRDIAAAALAQQQAPKPVAPAVVAVAPVPVPPAVVETVQVNARELLTEGRKYQKEGKLVEAMEKISAAQKAGGTYGPEEDTPALAAQQLALLCRKRTENLLRSADEVLSYAGNDEKKRDPAARCQEAEKLLAEAGRLITAFGQDRQPLESRLERLREMRGTAVAVKTSPVEPATVLPPMPTPVAVVTPVPTQSGTPVPPVPPPPFAVTTPAVPAKAQTMPPVPPPAVVVVTPPAPPVAPLTPSGNSGSALLQQAGRELYTGDTVSARRHAQEVLGGNFGMQNEAQEMLRRVAVEENNQRVLQGAREARNSAPVKQGEALLQKARLELSNGATGNARRFAEEAIAGNYGVQEEAQAVLRTIDAEESNQRTLEARRTFDAAVQAYNRGDYKQSGVLLGHVEMNQLDPARQTRFREIEQTAQMQPNNPERRLENTMPTTAVAQNPLTPANTNVKPVGYNTSAPGHATASDRDVSLLETTKALREVKFQKLRQVGLDAQREAAEKFKTGQTDAALETLQTYLNQLQDEQLSATQVAYLKRPIDSRLEQFKMMKAQRDYLTNETASHNRTVNDRSQRELVEENKQKKVAELMKKYNALYKQAKYEDAIAVALQAKDLDPDNAVAATAATIAKTMQAQKTADDIKAGHEKWFMDGLADAEREPPSEAIHGIAYDHKSWETVSKRKIPDFTIERRNTEERDIERRLNSPSTLHFQNMPLGQVIEDLRQQYALNIYVDEQALRDKGISQEHPVSIKLDQIALKSALSLMLHNLGLTYIIADGTLQITTPDKARGKMGLATHYVADLVIPVGNFGQLPYSTPGQPTPPLPGMMSTPPVPTPAPTPLIPPYSLQGGTPTGSSGIGAPIGSTDANNAKWSAPNPAQTQEKDLIRMITNVVSPQSWTDMGGPGTIDYHPLTMSLVINQTPDIQEQIASLLSALRRLQDQEVSVEVRFISVADDFYEHIGVNFNASINTNNQKFAPQLTSGAFAPPGFTNNFNPNGIVVGATQAGSLTSDLAIPIQNNTFFNSLPAFGGYPGIGVGGLTMGLAFLSDIQVYLFMEAVAGDTRTHVTQAPKLTLFNGQTATLNVQTNQNFVTNVQLTIVGNGNPVFVPTITTQPLGVQMTIQAVITADRRYVRMSLNPTLTALVPGPINAFPVIVPIFQGIADDRSSPITLTQLIQQPVTQSITVQTTVSVPDGGTVLLGGLKRLSEQRAEFGPPIVSNIPILNRLFKNVGFGRETESLLLMVTPRIIIQEEEEERQTGYKEPPEQGL